MKLQSELEFINSDSDSSQNLFIDSYFDSSQYSRHSGRLRLRLRLRLHSTGDDSVSQAATGDSHSHSQAKALLNTLGQLSLRLIRSHIFEAPSAAFGIISDCTCPLQRLPTNIFVHLVIVSNICVLGCASASQTNYPRRGWLKCDLSPWKGEP